MCICVFVLMLCVCVRVASCLFLCFFASGFQTLILGWGRRGHKGQTSKQLVYRDCGRMSVPFAARSYVAGCRFFDLWASGEGGRRPASHCINAGDRKSQENMGARTPDLKFLVTGSLEAKQRGNSAYLAFGPSVHLCLLVRPSLYC